MSIFELINEISDDEIVLPAIQRDFVWDEGRVELLFDSLFRGYPVGIVLLWETYQPIQYRRFVRDHVPGRIHKFEDNAKGRRMKLVLDGQQRLSSIYVALKGTFDGRTLYFDVLSGRDADDHSEVKFKFWFARDKQAKEENQYELTFRAEQLSQSATSRREPSFWVCLSDIVGRSPRDLQMLRDRIADDMQLTKEDRLRLELNIQNVGYALSGNSELLKTQTIDSKLPADDDKRKSAFDILEIFVRVNTQGMTLRRSDLIISMLRLYWPEASELLPKFLKEVNGGTSLNIDNDFVIRCMFSVAGIGTRLDFELLRKKSNVEAIKATYRRCFNSIRSTVDFVRAECAIDSSRLLGGINTLVPFVHYNAFTAGHVFPKGCKADARRALFLFAFGKMFTQHSESRTGAFIRDFMPATADIANGAPFSYRRAIEYVAWKAGFDTPDALLFGNNVELALSLIQRRSGGRIQFSANIPEIDHIFPRSVLEEKEADPQDIHGLGNFWILPRGLNRNKSAKHPAEFLSDVDDATLRAALIDRSLLDYRSFKKFVRERQERMAGKLREITGLDPKGFVFLQDVE